MSDSAMFKEEENLIVYEEVGEGDGVLLEIIKKEVDVNEDEKEKSNVLAQQETKEIYHLKKVKKETVSEESQYQKAKVPERFLLYDSLICEIVDYDKEDGSPIVEFSMCARKEDEQRLPVECGICPDVMARSKLVKHIKTHMKPNTKRYMCIYCDEHFVSRAYAAGHARRHMGIRPYVCDPCKLYYCTKQDLKVHQQRRHWKKEHICEKCGKTFAQNTSLKNHRIVIHEKLRRFECGLCGKRFLRNYAMKEHVRNVHLKDRKFLDCPFCNLKFTDTHKLSSHRRLVHSRQKDFACIACGLKFTSIEFFDAHRRSLQCRDKYKREDINFELTPQPDECQSTHTQMDKEHDFLDAEVQHYEEANQLQDLVLDGGQEYGQGIQDEIAVEYFSALVGDEGDEGSNVILYEISVDD